MEVELHKKEVDISQLDGKVDSLKDQLFLVTNNKQYDALMKEIDHLKDKKSASENETIELLDEKEELIKDVESMESELTGYQKIFRREDKSLKLQFQSQQMKNLFLKKKNKQEKIKLI